MAKIELLLDINPPAHGLYHPGLDVTGTVTVNRDKPSPIARNKYINIHVSLTGEIYVKSGELMGWAKDEILKQQVILWEMGKDPDNKLLPGMHNFPFSLKLVSNRFSSIPTTSDSHLGKVVYTVEARIVKEKRDACSRANVSVLEVVDINRQDLMQPSFRVMSRDLAYTPFSTSPVTVTCRMPRTGYSIHNDRIDIEVEVDNPKNRRVGSVNVHLFKNSTYVIGGSSRFLNRVVPGAGTTLVPTRPNSSSYTVAGCIRVPFTEPTSSNFSVQVSYYLSVVLGVPNSANMVMNFPISIGTVPVQHTDSLCQKSKPPLSTSPGQLYLTQPPYAPNTLPSQAGVSATQAPYAPPHAGASSTQPPYASGTLSSHAGASATQPPYASSAMPQKQQLPDAAVSTQPPYVPDMPSQAAGSTQPPYAPDIPPQAAGSTQPPYALDMLPPQSAVSRVPNTPEWATSPHDWPVTRAPLPPPPSYEETVAASNLPVATELEKSKTYNMKLKTDAKH